MRTQRKFLALLLSLTMALTLLPMSAMAEGDKGSAAPAETTETAPTTVQNSAELLAAAANGGTIQLAADVTLSTTLKIDKDTTLDAAGHTLTIEPAGERGINLATAAKLSLTDSGKTAGGILIRGASNGIWMYGGALNLNHVNLTIEGATGYAIYNCNDAAAFHQTDSALKIQNCGNAGDEGGIEWDHGTMAFDSGSVNITGCGKTSFGALYSGADVVFGNGVDPLTVNLENSHDSTGVKNTIVLVGGADITVEKNAVVNVTIAGKASECRGINVGQADSTVTVNGGTLNVSKDASCTAAAVYGVRASTGTPKMVLADGGVANISGYSAPETVLPGVCVTLDGGSMNLGGSFETAPAPGTLQLTADAALNETLTVKQTAAINTDGHTLTIAADGAAQGIYMVGAPTLTLTNSGAAAGGILIRGASNGIWLYGGALNLSHARLTIEKTTGYAIYNCNDAAAFHQTDSALKIQDCGNAGDEGGIDWDRGTMAFDSGSVNIIGCGKTSFGSIYSGADMVFGNGVDPLTVNLENSQDSTGVKNTITLVGGADMNIEKNASVNVTIAGKASECRGINVGQTDSTVTVNGGTLNVSKDASCTAATVYGVRASSGTPKLVVAGDSILNISGCTEKGALHGMDVAINGGSMNLGAGVTDTEKAGAASITNGADAVTMQKQAANAFTQTVTKAAKDSTVYPYTYTAHVQNGGVYAWLPAYHVNFYGADKTTLLGIAVFDSGATWGTVKTAAPKTAANFDSWRTAAGAALPDSRTLTGNTDVYASYQTLPAVPTPGDRTDGNTTPSGDTTITDPETPLADLPSALNTTDHFAYVQGYTDGTIRPNSNITRAEVATMFYRLLTAERRDEIFTAKNSYSDVPASAWYNKAVSSMTAGKYVTGYQSGVFGGNRSITRAEFVSIAVRFMDAKAGTVKFTDVPAKFWAHDAISTAVAYGWIDGYTDGTFRPNQPITRAEAMKILNTVLGRGVDAKGLLTGVKIWSDCADPTAWFYYEVAEATNSHTYAGARPSETWKTLSTGYTYDTAKYEKP